jgi:hypothetical protein
VPEIFILEDFLRGAVEHDLAHVQNQRTVREMQCSDSVLFDNDGRHAKRLDLFQRFLDFLHDNRRQPLLGFVEQD